MVVDASQNYGRGRVAVEMYHEGQWTGHSSCHWQLQLDNPVQLIYQGIATFDSRQHMKKKNSTRENLFQRPKKRSQSEDSLFGRKRREY